MYQITIEMGDTEIGVGAYQRPRAYLTDTANIDFKAEIEDPTWEVSGISGYLLSSPAGFTIFVATGVSSGKLYARTTVDGSVIEGYIDVTVSADYDWGIIDSGETETPAASREDAPFAKYSGYNKGVRRPFDSGETVYMDDTVQTLLVPAAATLDLLTPIITGSQSFSLNEISKSVGAGFGRTPFGLAE